jgi:hypothetical protein
MQSLSLVSQNSFKLERHLSSFKIVHNFQSTQTSNPAPQLFFSQRFRVQVTYIQAQTFSSFKTIKLEIR